MSASISVRNNNPGNLRYTTWTAARGAEPGEAGFAKFLNPVIGTKVLAQLLTTKKYIERTIEQTFYKYAPPNDNNTEKYIKFVCDELKITRETIIKELEPLQFLDLQKAIIKYEGWRR